MLAVAEGARSSEPRNCLLCNFVPVVTPEPLAQPRRALPFLPAGKGVVSAMSRSGRITRSFTASTSAPRAPLPPSSAPTAAFRAHHDVAPPRIDGAAFHPGWSVQTRLLSLHAAGKIDREALDAALAWRAWAEITSPTRAQSWQVRVDISPGPRDADATRRVAAAARLRAAAAALGALRVAILEAVVLRDVSWAQLGRLLHLSDKSAREYAGEAVAALAAWRAGDPVPPAPIPRLRVQPGAW